jgi:glycosyltransferase involved in cell wall biosynthesis
VDKGADLRRRAPVPTGGAAPTPKVLLVGQGPPSRGGIPTFLNLLLRDPSLRRQARLAFFNTTRDGQRPAAATLSNAGAAVRDAWRLRRRARQADVVHLNVAPTPLLPLVRSLMLVLAAKKAGARVIVHAHSGRLHIAARRQGYRLTFRGLLALTDAVAVVSHDGEVVVRALGGDPVLIRNGVDTALFSPGQGPHAGPLVVTFVGTVCERKGLEDLRSALVELAQRGAIDDRRTRIVIAGDSGQEGPGVFERVRSRYEDSGLRMVEFVGALQPERIPELLGRTDIFCLPSHREGLPMAALEAMAAGVAIVATSVGDLPQLLADGAGIIVPPHRPGQIAAALDRLLRDPDERARLGRAARARVVREFDRARVVEEVASLYRRIAYSM